MDQLTLGNVLLAEYIGQGAGNKHTLVNVFPGEELNVPQMPARLQLALYAEILPRKNQPKNMTIEVTVGDKLYAKVEASFEEQTPKRVMVLAISPLTAVFEKDGDIKFVAKCDGFEPTLLLSKRVRLVAPTSANASPPPSERSPTDAPESSKPTGQKPPASGKRKPIRKLV